MYYHIKKPETIGLIEAVKEGQAGNMKQKYYLAKQIDGSQFTLMAEDISEESDYVIGKLYQFANKAIFALARELIEGREDHRGEASVINVELSKIRLEKIKPENHGADQ
ncbi:MAG: hypothetical protein C6W57_11980 [Caldibacillus debilis]|nr:MAG: hypothetical protein C6W57_11980 [Caldibacillus debilis]